MRRSEHSRPAETRTRTSALNTTTAFADSRSFRAALAPGWHQLSKGRLDIGGEVQRRRAAGRSEPRTGPRRAEVEEGGILQPANAAVIDAALAAITVAGAALHGSD
jgi:hypothetical protein